METKWLEDFVSLAETRSFSRSAQLRHVTQPAFSRRIQALEAWAGIDLVDRSSYPTRLTPAGETFHAQALEILDALQATRNMMRGHQAARPGHDRVRGAAHAGLHLLPALADGPAARSFGAIKSRLIALNVHDAVLRLTEGGCDLLIAYHHPAQPLQLSPERYEMLTPRAARRWRPMPRPTPTASRCSALPGARSASAVPFLGYAPGAYMARLVELIVKQAGEPLQLDPIYETDMAEGLKAMALEGHGLAFLPASSVRKELQARAPGAGRRRRAATS